ncbi:hypothetical protein Ntsu_59760 [Nocardia sp. IFM 10818]
MKGLAVRRAKRRVLVAADSKFGMSSFCRFAEISDFEALVTGTELAPAEAGRFEALGPPLFVPDGCFEVTRHAGRGCFKVRTRGNCHGFLYW